MMIKMDVQTCELFVLQHEKCFVVSDKPLPSANNSYCFEVSSIIIGNRLTRTLIGSNKHKLGFNQCSQ